MATETPSIRNKKAFHDYEVLERFEAGIALVGTEVKSIRAGKVKLLDAFCRITDQGELILQGMEISPYAFGNIHNHPAARDRKLLMHKKEILRLSNRMAEKGFSLIPLAMYFKKGKVKVEIALCKGKKLHDKRQSMKEKDAKLEINRALKSGR